MRPLGAWAGGILGLAGASLMAGAVQAQPAAGLPSYAFTESRGVTAASGGGFTTPRIVGADSARLTRTEILAPGGGLAQWRSSEVSRFTAGGAVDTVRFTSAGLARAPGGLVTAAPGSMLPPDDQAYDVSYTRGWPTAIRRPAGAYDLEVTPFAGVGLGSFGGSAEAGAVVRYGPGARDDKVVERLRELGVQDGAAYGDRGRWYLFAAASGRAVGLNLLGDDRGGLRNTGWSTDTAATIGDAQVGVGWRRGATQASVGYMHRELNPRHAMAGLDMPDDDQMVAFSLSIKPQR